MLAYFRSEGFFDASLGDAVARSLGLFDGRDAEFRFNGNAIYAQTRHSASSRRSRGWSPHTSSSGLTVLFNGFLDNIASLQAQLELPGATPSAVYAAAFERWDEAADLQIIGEYCAIIAFPNGDIRLSRSPWRAPPLHFAQSGQTICAASVPRILHVCGLAQKLDQAKFAANQYAVLNGMEGWYEGSFQIALGQSVTIKSDGWAANQYYDHLAPRKEPAASREDYLAKADTLLSEACHAMVQGAAKPGIFLSGGLDSSNVAARVLGILPTGKALASFTFRPHIKYQAKDDEARSYADDWPAVQKFAAMHPALRPFASRDAPNFDAKLQEMFLAAGIAPIGLQNMLQYHALFAEAKKQGCDLLLDAEMGNATFSNAGPWAFSEYLLRGKWRQLAMAVEYDPERTGPRLWTFLTRSIAPLLPRSFWHGLARLIGRNVQAPIDLLSTLKESAVRRFDLRSRASPDLLSGRPHFATRKAFMHALFDCGEMNAGDITQGFQQLYGISQRDPTSYRPFVEFCLGLPTEMFLHDGQDRWLAREMGKGLMPEAQRLDTRTGLHSPDWHERLTPQLPQFRAELIAAESDPDVADLLDTQRMIALIDDWPAKPAPDNETVLKFGMALPRAIMMIRYARFVSGRNEP